MMKIFVTYSNGAYSKAKRFNIWTANNIAGFDKTYSLTPEDIDESFVKKNKNILSQKKGAGLWLWKPWAIKYAFDRANEGDYIFYTDAACFWIRSVNHIIKAMTDDVWICDISLIEEQFTKPSLFKQIKCESDKFRKTRQRPAVFIGLRKSALSEKIINEWLDYCQKEECIFPETNIDLEEGKSAGFISHREDQSILSLITKKYHIEPHHNPSFSGLIPEFEVFGSAKFCPTNHEKEYPVCVIHHRKPRVGIGVLLKNIIYLTLPRPVLSMYAKRKNRNRIL